MARYGGPTGTPAVRGRTRHGPDAPHPSFVVYLNAQMSISETTLIRRIRSALAKDQQALRIPRPGTRAAESGIHIVDLHSNFMVAEQCSLEGLAQELGINTAA